ncbi:aldehyde oxidase GLOX1-like protein [Tanacetum coccineum]
MPGGQPRNYPSTGSAVLLPLQIIKGIVSEVEILVCGGAPKGEFVNANRGRFDGALDDCGRIKIFDSNPQCVMETIPMARVMGDMLLLPNSHVLIINGASSRVAGIIEACEAVTTKHFGGSGHEAFGGYNQKPLKAAIKSLWRILEILVWVLFCIIPCGPVYGNDEELQVDSLLENDGGSCEGSCFRRERNLCEELYDKGYHVSGMNLIEGVDWEAERLKAINKRLCKRLVGRLCKRLSGKLFRRVCEQIYAL